MWDLVLCVVAGFLFVLVALQIFYIRATLATYEKEKYKILNAGSSTLPGSINNTLKVYGLNIHKRHTTLVNDTTQFTAGFVVEIPDSMYISCAGVPTAKDVVFRRGTWLALNRNDGCNNLLQDVLSKRTRYIIIDNVLYVVHFDRELVEKLRASLDSNENFDRMLLADQEFLYVTKVDNSFDFAEPADSTRCVASSSIHLFRLQPSSTASLTNLITQVQSATGSTLPVVVVGFSTTA